MKKSIVWIIVVSVLLGSVIAAAVLVLTKPESKRNPNKKQIIGVRTMVAQPGDYSVDMTYPGRVAARSIIALTSEVNGMLMPTQRILKVGEQFRKGDVIAKIYDEDVRATHQAQVSQFLSVLANSLPDIKIDFPELYDKWYAFFTQIEIDELLPDLPTIESSREKVYISSRNILSSYYNLRRSEIVLTRYEVRAPFNGVFLTVNKEVGSVTSANSVIAQITSTDMLELVVGVSLSDAKNLSEGTTVDVMSHTGESYKGVIDRIAPFVDQVTQRVNVYVLFSEPSMTIVEGQVLNLTMPSATLHEATKCSREALVGDTAVYAVANNQLVLRPVEVLATTHTSTYIKGVAAGDTLVGESLVSPYPGMPVLKLNMQGDAIK